MSLKEPIDVNNPVVWFDIKIGEENGGFDIFGGNLPSNEL